VAATTEQREPNARTWERHWQSVSAVAIIGLLGWNLLTAHQSAVQLAALQESIAGLQARLTDISERTADRYTGEDAEKDFRVRDQILRDHQDRLREIERRLPPINAGDPRNGP